MTQRQRTQQKRRAANRVFKLPRFRPGRAAAGPVPQVPLSEPPLSELPLTPGQRVRQVANVVNGTTLLGLALARAAGTTVSRGPRGLIMASGYRWRLPFAGAFTMGNVIISRGLADRLIANAALLRHEERHCSQYAYCLGVPFLPLYFLAAGWSLLRTGDPASANFFERQAGLEAGGYPGTWTRKPAPRGAGRIEV